MSLVGGYSRDELRRTYSDAWRKHLASAPLTSLEAMIAAVVGLHPEYQGVVADIDKAHTSAAAGSDASTGRDATTGPFLHMGLHMAVREQLSVDRPPGIREVQRQLLARYHDPHQAEHVLVDALAETLWEAQRAGRPPDEAHYLERARRG